MTPSPDKPKYHPHFAEAPIGIFEVNQKGEYIDVNKSACDIVGYSKEAMLDMSVADLSPTGEDPGDIPSFAELGEEGYVRSELELLHKDGHKVDVILDAVALDNGRFVGYVQDNTAQKEYERELREVKNRFQSLFEKAPEEIAIHDSSGNILEVNQQEIEHLGYSQDELTAMHVSDIEVGVSQAEAQALWDQMDMGETRKREGKLKRKDGSTYPAEVWANKIEIDGNVRFLAFVRDITERKERERQLRREKQRLDEFASVVSHDLRNPLNIAQGRIELAQEEYTGDHLEDAAEGVKRALSLIDDLLDLAKAGQGIGDIEPVEVSNLVRSCWNNVDTAGATIVINIESTIQADWSRLCQLFENMFRNAIQHGGKDVTVRIGPLSDGFYVEDDGRGIPKSTQDELFEKGYSKSSEGIGFGLSIVEQIATAHDWDIRIAEGSKDGARFEFTGVEIIDT